MNNEGAYHSASFDRIATAVTNEAPFKIDLDAPAVPLVQNGTLPLKVRLTRSPGYAEKISVRFQSIEHAVGHGDPPCSHQDGNKKRHRYNCCTLQ